MQNRALRDDIRDYWGLRAQSYDQSPGHGRMSQAEAGAWAALITRHLGQGQGRRAFDPGCGTGVMTGLLAGCGFAATGMDFAEPMLKCARQKPGRFLIGDAQDCREATASYDVILARNLVWTLTEPEAAFRDWLRILKPGGRLLIIDGNFVRPNRVEQMLRLLDPVIGRLQDGHSALTPAQWAEHDRIVTALPFRQGLRCDALLGLLRAAGFTDPRRESLASIRRARFPLISRGRLIACAQHRFALSMAKPG